MSYIELNLTGSKLGCGEGGCGACTVLVSQCVDQHSGSLDHRTVNACLAPLCSIDGCQIITVEGLGSVAKSNLHPTQSRLAEMYGSQCGFCTPGIIMSLYGTVAASNQSHSSMTMLDIEEAFDGNLCRCTGYRPILDAAKSFAKDFNELPDKDPSSSKCSITTTTLDKCRSFVKDLDNESNKIEFPNELREHVAQSIHIKGSTIEWFRPVSLNELLSLRSTYPGAASKLVFGNSEVQIETKFKRLKYPRLISVTHIQELQQLKRTPTSLILGAGVTLTRLQAKLSEWNDQQLDGGICESIIQQLKFFASTQIRNVASLGGNIVNASPISDLNPVLQAAGAILELHRTETNSTRLVPMQEFFLAYRRVAMTDDEVLVCIHIPLPPPPSTTTTRTFLRSYKQARRRDDDIGIVSAGLKVQLEPAQENDKQQWRIISASFSFGGMGPTTILTKNTQQELIGKLWTKTTINEACQLALKEMPLTDLTPGGQPEYRRTLVQSFLFKFYLYVCTQLQESSVDSKELSATQPYHRSVSHGQQIIPERPASQKVVGASLPHRSAYLQTTGEAKYVDDMPSLPNTLYGGLVLATQPNALIKSIGKII